MIQPAAPSITSSLTLNTGSQAAQGDDAAVSGDFAALLKASLPSGGDKRADAAATLDQAIALQLRQQPGNPSGNELPLPLPELDAALADAAKVDAATADAPALGDTIAIPKLNTILPGLLLPFRLQKATKTAITDTPSPLTGLVKAALGRQAPVAPAEKKISPIEADSDADTDTTDTADTELAVAIAPDAAPTILPLIQLAVPTPIKAAADVAPPATPLARATVQPAVAAPVAEQTAEPTPALASLVMPLIDASAAKTADAAKIADTAAPMVTVSMPKQSPVVAKTAEANPQTSVPAGPQVEAMAAAPARQAAAPQPEAKVEAEAPATTARSDDTTPKAAFAAAAQNAQAPDQKNKPASPASPADTPTLQAPSLAAIQPQSILPQGDAQTFAQTIDPVTAAATAPVRHPGHDFSAIVDRLVEAREAAMPQAVSASISHGEFGQVSLRFDQDAGGLSVAMSSADPDFARAVQASAASAQSHTASDNGSTAARQDAQQQQQTAGSPSGQPQPQSNSQANSQASARNDRSAPAQTDNRSGSQAGDQGQDDESADTRSGIYA